jgi:hypothetical protein
MKMSTEVREVREVAAVKVIDSIVKSASDNRNYRALVLPNELQVMLISDMETDRSAASLSVAVGKNCPKTKNKSRYMYLILFILKF